MDSLRDRLEGAVFCVPTAIVEPATLMPTAVRPGTAIVPCAEYDNTKIVSICLDKAREDETLVRLGKRFTKFTFIRSLRTTFLGRHTLAPDVARKSSMAGIRIDLIGKSGIKGVFKAPEQRKVEHFDLLAMIRQVGLAQFLDELFVWSTDCTTVLQLRRGGSLGAEQGLLPQTMSPQMGLQLCVYRAHNDSKKLEAIVEQMLSVGAESFQYNEDTHGL